MARLIVKSPYFKGSSAKPAGGYLRYIATRERVEILPDDRPPTKRQTQLIEKLTKDFPDTKTLLEYGDYTSNPTKFNASQFLTLAMEENWGKVQEIDGYAKYIATCPRAERLGEHGLFGDEDAVDLTAAMAEVNSCTGNIWTHIISLRREDAERLGFDYAGAWRALLRAHRNDIADAMHIPPEDFRWYAAFHDEGGHPHVHMMAWSDDPKYGFLRKDKLLHLQSILTNMIYADELKAVYVEKDIAYKDVTGAARETMRRIVDQLETVENPSELIRQELMEIALELHTVNGKKQYGYLKKPLKDKVDGVVDELEKLPEVAACYSVCNDLRDTLEGYYKSKPRQHNPLSQQKEFRAIKNAIIQEAERLRQQTEQDSSQDEEPSAENTPTDASANPTLADENTSSTASHHARLPSEYLLNSTVRLFHQMGQIFRDNAAPPSNPMVIRIDSKRRKKLMQKRLAMGHKQDDHEQAQGYEQSL